MQILKHPFGFCEKVKYLGVDIDHKLKISRLCELVKLVRECMLSRTFLGLTSKPMACMLFKMFVVSLLLDCLPVLNTSLCARDKKLHRKVFSQRQESRT